MAINYLHLNQRGVTLTQVMITMSVISAFSVAIMALMQNQLSVQQEMNLKTTALTLRQNLIGTIANHQAWSQTRTKNSLMKCLQPNQIYCNSSQISRTPITLYDARGGLIHSSTPTAGYTTAGLPCSTFSSTNGNDSCPLKVVVEWRGVCSTAPCTSMEDIVNIQFVYNPRNRKAPFNVSAYNLLEQPRTMISGSDSPFITCASIQRIFIGTGKSFNGHNADTLGCVPYSAFQGPEGARGPTGATGPQGPSGADAVCP